MVKYYTRACNFYYGKFAKNLIKEKKALPLCGNVNIAFDKVEIYVKNKKKIKSKIIELKQIHKVNKKHKVKIFKDIKKITAKRKNFIKNIDFKKTAIMGILNVTPDSFSDGGKYNSFKKSKKHILKMIKSGAKIIDIGAESTRPGSKTVPAKKEWRRLEKVIKNFKKKFKKTTLSLDTRKSEIMIKGVQNGVDIINDVSGFNYEKNSLKKIQNLKVIKVIHHMQGTPQTMQINPKYDHVLLDIYDFFEKKINTIKDKNIIIDPGIGFGKNLKHNLTLISNISLFHSLGFPILVGTSKKRFIGQISKEVDSKNRIGGTLASVLFLISQGVQIFRVHDVKEINQGVKVFKNLI